MTNAAFFITRATRTFLWQAVLLVPSLKEEKKWIAPFVYVLVRLSHVRSALNPFKNTKNWAERMANMANKRTLRWYTTPSWMREGGWLCFGTWGPYSRPPASALSARCGSNKDTTLPIVSLAAYVHGSHLCMEIQIHFTQRMGRNAENYKSPSVPTSMRSSFGNNMLLWCSMEPRKAKALVHCRKPSCCLLLCTWQADHFDPLFWSGRARSADESIWSIWWQHKKTRRESRKLSTIVVGGEISPFSHKQHTVKWFVFRLFRLFRVYPRCPGPFLYSTCCLWDIQTDSHQINSTVEASNGHLFFFLLVYEKHATFKCTFSPKLLLMHNRARCTFTCSL